MKTSSALLLFMDIEMTYEEFKKMARQEYPTITNRCMREIHELEFPGQYTIADTPPTTNQKGWWHKQKEEGINPMNNDFDCCGVPVAAYGCKPKRMVTSVANAQVINAVPVEATQRDYAIELVKSIGEKHAQALRVQFNMDVIYPRTFLELEALVKSGNYQVSDEAKDENAKHFNIFYGVHFGKPKDKDGYNAARDILKAAAQKALTAVTLKPIDQLEAVIEDFEAWVYTPAN